MKLQHDDIGLEVTRRQAPPLVPWLVVLFVGSAALGAYFLLGPALSGGGYYRSVLNRVTYGYNRQVLVLCIPYALVLWAWWRGKRVATRWLLGGAVALHLLVLFAPLPQSQDFYQYLYYGRMQSAYHLNPYVIQPSSTPFLSTDNWYNLIRWPNQTTVYGPVWTLLSFGVAKVAGDSFTAGVVLMKLVVFALDCTVMGLILAAARDREDAHGAAGWGLLAYAWNPLILITVPLGGLADVAVAAGLIGALVARRRGRSGVATALLALATLVKVYAGVGLILHLVLVARERSRREAMRQAGVAAAIGVATFWPYWHGLGTFRGLLNIADLSNKSLTGTSQRLLVPLLRALGFHAALDDAAAMVRWIVAPIMIGAVLWAVRRVRTDHDLWYGTLVVLCVYILFTPWYLYWYLVAPVALVAVLPRNRLTLPVLTFSGTTLITARFAPWLLGQTVQTLLRYGPPLAVLWRQPPPPDEPMRRITARGWRTGPDHRGSSSVGRFVTLA